MFLVPEDVGNCGRLRRKLLERKIRNSWRRQWASGAGDADEEVKIAIPELEKDKGRENRKNQSLFGILRKIDSEVK
jgi:hypothetical protein